MTKAFGALWLSLALTACQSADPPASSPTNEPVAVPALVRIPSTPIPTPVSLKSIGAYVHEGSSIAFPDKAAGFERSDVSRYDLEGNDVGVHYRKIRFDGAAVFRSEVTLFVFPSKRRADGAPVPFDEQFDSETQVVRRTNADARELRRIDSDAVHGGAPVHLRAAEFAFQGGPQLGRQQVITTLVVFLRGAWRVDYRADFPPQRRDACLADVEQLLAALGLPPTGLPATASAAAR